ncbi:MAG TPA: hypothetical protein EYP19_08350, partial [Desulfobacterales bacterium]|nr:hypothetical protein [Desulfobacterales bacterium]
MTPVTKEPKMVRVNFTAPKELIERVEQFAQERLEDRSTAIRQLVQEGLKALLTDKVLEQFQRGGLSLREASARLGIDLREFQDLLRQREIPASGVDRPEGPDVKLLRKKA